jgi:hypothetical protein
MLELVFAKDLFHHIPLCVTAVTDKFIHYFKNRSFCMGLDFAAQGRRIFKGLNRTREVIHIHFVHRSLKTPKRMKINKVGLQKPHSIQLWRFYAVALSLSRRFRSHLSFLPPTAFPKSTSRIFRLFLQLDFVTFHAFRRFQRPFIYGAPVPLSESHFPIAT